MSTTFSAGGGYHAVPFLLSGPVCNGGGGGAVPGRLYER